MSLVKKYLNPQNDVAFKRIFGTEKNKDILIAMLNAVLKNQLHTPITVVSFLSPFQEPEALAKKQSVVDVLCRDADGCQYIIEMQVASAKGFEERAQYYASKAFINQLNEGEGYHDLKEVIFLAFCNFSIFPEKKDFKSEHVTLDKKTGENNLDKLSFTFIDLVKFDENRTKAVNELTLEEKFYYFLRHAPAMNDEALHELIGNDKIIKKAFYELERFGWSEMEIRRYEQEDKRVRDNKAVLLQAIDEGIKKGMEEGVKAGVKAGKKKGEEIGMEKGIKAGKKKGEEIGIEKGKKEEKVEIARNLLLQGVDAKIIEKSTGLSRQSIEQIKRELEN